MDTSTLVLGLRVALSLACVLGLIWWAGRRMAGSQVVRRRRTEAMTVVGRQSLGGRNGLAMVDVGGRRLLLGVGDHGVTLLTELEPPAPEPEDAGPAGRAERVSLTPEELAVLAADADGDLPLDVELPCDLSGLDGSDLPGHDGPATVPDAVPTPRGGRADGTHPSSTPAARTPAVTEPRNPLEGSILDAATWRRAVVAVQERTIRR